MLFCAVLLATAGCSQMGAPQHAGQPTEQGKSMAAMLADVNLILAFTYGSGDQRTAEAAATDLVAWSNRMAELFPPGRRRRLRRYEPGARAQRPGRHAASSQPASYDSSGR